MTPLETLPDHDRFIEACDRHRIDAADAEELWRDLAGIEPPAPAGARHPLSRSAVATMVAGTLVLSAAGMWWISLVTSAAGAPGLLALALAWVAAGTAAAELARRRALPYLDAGFALVGAAYVTVAVAAGEYLLIGSSFGSHWWGRLPVELALLGAGTAVVLRYRQSLLSMVAPTLAIWAISIDALVTGCHGWDADLADWPAWAGPAAIAGAAAVTAVALVLDRRALREWAFWPAVLADAMTVAAAVTLAVATFGAGSLGVGAAMALAGIAVLGRGMAVGRLTQIGLGAAVFWVGTIVVGSHWGDLVVACLTTLAGVTLIAGAVGLTRRSSVIEQRRRAVGR
jgi:hypothetical protein